MTHASPLRYPGGKGRLAAFLEDAIDLNDLRNGAYFEPYAGGAGAALALLDSGVVKEIYLNDADRRIYCFWKSVLHNSDEFAQRIMTTPVNIDEWQRQALICANPERHRVLDVGFAAFFMNRCNRSGVLMGAGPIGGYTQSGKWKLDVRFNREWLASRVREIAKKRDAVHVSGLDAIVFLRKRLPRGADRAKVFVYLDPPYVEKAQRLYLNAYTKGAHASVSRYLQDQRTLHWIMSYDDSPLIRSLYRSCRIGFLPIQYSLQVKRAAHELIIAPTYVTVPSRCKSVRGLSSALKGA